MWPVIGGLISGGAGLLGSFFSSDTSKDINANNIAMQRETNQMSAAEAQKMRDFQYNMSSTAYQRASADMQQAGLNPAMMFGSGGAASTPGGAQASFSAPRATENPGRAFENIGQTINGAINASVSAKTMDKLTEEIANVIADNARIKASTSLLEAQRQTEQKRPQQVVEQTELTNRERQLKAAGIPAATIEYLMNKGVWETFTDDQLKKMGVLRAGMDAVGKTLDTALPFVSGAKSAVKHLYEWKYPKVNEPKRSTVERTYDDPKRGSYFEERFQY